MALYADVVDYIIDFIPVEWYAGNHVSLMEKYELSINWKKFSYRRFSVNEFNKFIEMIYWPVYLNFIKENINNADIINEFIRIAQLNYEYILRKCRKTKLFYHPELAAHFARYIDWSIGPTEPKEILQYHMYFNSWATNITDPDVCQLAVQRFGLDYVLKQKHNLKSITHLICYFRYWKTYPNFTDEELNQLLPMIPLSIIKYLPKYTKITDQIAEKIYNKVDHDCLFQYATLSFNFLITHHPKRTILKNIPTDYKIYKEKTNGFVRSDSIIILGPENKIIIL
jgi:hypothetical protein